jgi:DNA-binding beta-propeller fold protein YncE
LLDPSDNNRIAGGFRSEDVQANPYLAFPHPGGRYLYVGLPPGPISDPDIRHKLEGSVVVMDMKTWKPVKYFTVGFDPIWTAFTADGQYAYVGDGGSDEIFKIDNTTMKLIGASRSSVHGGYGIHLNWDDTKLYVVEKGEASHNRGKALGLVDPVAMTPSDTFETHCLRGDHGLLHPDPAKNELWISYNSNFRDVVFDLTKNEIKKTITHTGSSHNGAFVKYAVNADGSWAGTVLSDQAGLHGSARALKEDKLGVKEIVFKSEKVDVNVFRSK